MAKPNIPDEKILEKYNSLPDDLKAALFSSAVTNNIFEVGKKYGLAIDKIGELADETGLVMLGITKPSEYVRNLAQRLGVEQEKAKAIAEEINQKVFQQVRESLKKVHGLGEQPPAPKPLPKREDIVKPEIKPIEIKQVLPPTFPKPEKPAERPSATQAGPPSYEVAGVVPPIFVKKLPIPDLPPKPDIVPAPKEQLPQNSLAAKTELEKALGEQPQPMKPTYQSNDPYREPME